MGGVRLESAAAGFETWVCGTQPQARRRSPNQEVASANAGGVRAHDESDGAGHGVRV